MKNFFNFHIENIKFHTNCNVLNIRFLLIQTYYNLILTRKKDLTLSIIRIGNI